MAGEDSSNDVPGTLALVALYIEVYILNLVILLLVYVCLLLFYCVFRALIICCKTNCPTWDMNKVDLDP